MKIAMDKIKVMERIRKEISKIDELADDIQKNGLINAITVMPLDGGEYQLLAGFRRMKAAQSLGWTEMEGHIVSPADAEAALRVEIAENEQREPFTFTEKVYFGLLLEEIEAAKAKKRMSIGGTEAGRGRPKPAEKGTDARPYPIQGESRDVIGAKINMSGRQYNRAKYIVANATPEMIMQLDKGERTIYQTYNELRAKEKAAKNSSVPNIPSDTAPAAPPTRQAKSSKAQDKTPKLKLVSSSRAVKNDPYFAKIRAQEAENGRIAREFAALSPEGKIADLQRQLREERARSAEARSELASLKELRHNDVYHMQGNIDNLQTQISRLTAALDAANARIRELEAEHESA